MAYLKSISKEEKLILRPQGFVDVAAGRVLAGQGVAIKRGKVVGLIHEQEITSLVENQGYRIEELPRLFLMPGLIDCHVHLALDGIDTLKAIDRWEERPAMVQQVTQALINNLTHGVVAIRDGGDKPCYNLELPPQIPVPSPLVQASGYAVRRQGYYGTFLGPGGQWLKDFKVQVKELQKMGAKQLKVTVSGVVSFSQYGHVGKIQFTLEELTQIVRLAHELGMKVMAHVNSDRGVRLAAEAGVDSVEHGCFVTDETLDFMAQRGTAWIPTLVPFYAQITEPWLSTQTPEQVETITKTLRNHQEQLARAKALGVLLGVGTDAGAKGVYHGKSYYTELKLFQKAGLSNQAILKAATVDGARIIGLEGLLGEIKPGALPYFIAVTHNPLEKLETLQEVQWVTYLC